jgi:hypothetical protein
MEGLVVVNASIVATDDSLSLEIMRSDDAEIELCETDVIKACGSISDPSLIMTDDDDDDEGSTLTSLILLSIMILLSMLILLSTIITLVVLVTELANDDLSVGPGIEAAMLSLLLLLQLLLFS